MIVAQPMRLFLKLGLGVTVFLIFRWVTEFDLYEDSSAANQNAVMMQVRRADVVDLLSNWEYYQGDNLNIEGHFECLTARFCDFVPIPWLTRIAWVDLKNLPSNERSRIQRSCGNTCNIVLRGQVNATDIIAWDVLEIDSK